MSVGGQRGAFFVLPTRVDLKMVRNFLTHLLKNEDSLLGKNTSVIDYIRNKCEGKNYFTW